LWTRFRGRFWYPFLGPPKIFFVCKGSAYGTLFWPSFLEPTDTRAEVRILYSWTTWLFDRVLASREYVVINMDETALPRLIARRAGNVAALVSGTSREQLFERVARQESHGHVTLVACIASDASLQPFLPQFILAKDARLAAIEKHALRNLRPPMAWLEGTNGWMTSLVLCAVLTRVRRALAACAPLAEIAFLMDSAPQHVQPRVLAHAARLRLHLLFVPSRVTWLLQPLDTHVFASLKTNLHALQTHARGAHEGGRLPRGLWINLIEEAVRGTLTERAWAHAFSDNGLATGRGPTRRRIGDACGSVLPVAPRAPRDEDVQYLVGRAVPKLAARALSRSLRVATETLPLLAEAVPASSIMEPPIASAAASAS
jgi:hypothetical protein